jgi:hypothetical protein
MGKRSVFVVSGTGLRSLLAQQQEPKSLPSGQQFQLAWTCRLVGIVQTNRRRRSARQPGVPNELTDLGRVPAL